MDVERKGDDGLGLVEAIVAIVLFGLLAMAMVPPMILAMQISAKTTTTATAAQVAQGQIESAREAASDCAAFIAAIPSGPYVRAADARGIEYQVKVTATAPDGDPARDDATWCSNDSRAAVTYRVEVTALNAEEPDAANVTTIISVPGIGH